MLNCFFWGGGDIYVSRQGRLGLRSVDDGLAVIISCSDVGHDRQLLMMVKKKLFLCGTAVCVCVFNFFQYQYNKDK